MAAGAGWFNSIPACPGEAEGEVALWGGAQLSTGTGGLKGQEIELLQQSRLSAPGRTGEQCYFVCRNCVIWCRTQLPCVCCTALCCRALPAIGAALHPPTEGFVLFPVLPWRKPLEDGPEVGNG